MNASELRARAEAIAPWIVQIRRDLHRIPEGNFEERKTQALVMRVLDGLGISYTARRTWVVAEIRGAKPGPTAALRADMDGLHVTEPEGCPFRSEHEGWMHACGHDAHTAIQLGAARLLSEAREELRGSVRLLFQPAEETVGGAAPMIEDGALEGVSAIYGLHVQPYMNVGEMDTREGCLNASTDDIDLTVHGVAGHAARPEQARDAIVIAAELICQLQTLISREVSPLIPAVLTFGRIGGGQARNVICDRVALTGTLRTADREVRAFLKRRIREMCDSVARAYGAAIDVDITDDYCPLINDPAETARVLRVAGEMLGREHVHTRNAPSMGGEDFGFYLEKCPGAFYHIGCASAQPAAPLHSRDFVLDERCLPIGCALECAMVFDRLNGEGSE